ncbi:DUF4041 domain-containing protein [Lactobacillus sp. Sy-1]|uniref:DUF4041 domain-containing protein n=1 Tax=Lactobacillus sp. Sy-1 TaxID=2109645 RepID=UPI001C5BD7F3|nr:DUF4041 domain-containing protein [Lactobacillus sp. Sy-1]MBW1606056.1 DUF4041 domain-containing protein [Lactobacillus sp. Sy-1]
MSIWRNAFAWLNDAIHVNRFKQEIASLNNNIDGLNGKIADLTNQKEKLVRQLDVKLSIQQMSVAELASEAEKLKEQIADLDSDINKRKSNLKYLIRKIKEENQRFEDLRAEVGDLSSQVEISDYGLFNPNYEFEHAWQYKDRLDEIRADQKALIKSKDAVNYNPNWTVNNKKSLGRKMNNNQIKAILRSFNNECTEAIKKANYSNYDRIKARIGKSFEQLNKMYAVNEISIKDNYLNLKYQELEIAFKYECKKQDEKEELQEQRRIERENAAVKREAEKQQKQIQKDVDHYNKAIQELQLRLQKEQENEGLKNEIESLKQQIQDKDVETKSLNDRVYNARAGYVYIISNIGSFGENIVKIGVTRRLKPEERVKELSSASVPFKFDVHAFIYSSDAFELENKLHQRFNDQRVNLINNHKEFFKITLAEIEQELKQYDNVTVDFNEYPEADEYRETVKIEKSKQEQAEMKELLNV